MYLILSYDSFIMDAEEGEKMAEAGDVYGSIYQNLIDAGLYHSGRHSRKGT